MVLLFLFLPVKKLKSIINLLAQVADIIILPAGFGDMFSMAALQNFWLMQE
jgi:hypothetical protein